LGVAVFSTTYNQFGDTGWEPVGGTSAGAPAISALVALANQKRAEDGREVLGANLNNVIYRAAKRDYAGNFNDITEGSNGFEALVGYDLVTGLGSPKATTFIQSLADDTSTAAANLTFQAARLLRDVNADPNRPNQQVFFGGTGFAEPNGADYDFEIIPNASSGVSMTLPGPLVNDGTGNYSAIGEMSIVIDSKHTETMLIKFVAHIERRNRRDHLVGEFFAISSRGKVLYNGDRPAFYGTFYT